MSLLEPRDAPADDAGPAAAASTRIPRRDAVLRRLLAAADAVAVLAVLIGGDFVRGGRSLPLPGVLATITAAAVIVAAAQGLYGRDRRRLRPLSSVELPQMLGWALVVVAATVLVEQAAGARGPSVTAAAAAVAVLAVLAVALRAAARSLWRESTAPERVVVIGTTALKQALERKHELFADMHARVVAHIPAVPATPEWIDRLAELLGAEGSDGPDRVIVEAVLVDDEQHSRLVAMSRVYALKLGYVPPLPRLFSTAAQIDHVAELPIVQYGLDTMGSGGRFAKRLLDVVVSALGLAVLSPLLLVVSIAVRIDTRGPVLFRQVRAGQTGRPITVLKFRTMVADAEERLAEMVALESLPTPMYKLRGDPRITRIGRLLRRTSLDEVPQLVNVLRGEMSLVGIRPEQIEIARRYSPAVRSIRLSGRPGLTGPMQVFGRGDLTFEERLAVERDYIENRSLRRDLHILLLTCGVVLRGRGAY